MQRLTHAVVLLCLLLPCPAGAAPIYWQLNGEITYNPPSPDLPYAELDSLLPAGTDVTFLITVDPAAPDLCDRPGAGLYYLPAATMSFGGHSYTADPFEAWIEVNNILGNCAVDTVTRIRINYPFGLATIEFYPGPGDALPTRPPSFANLWVGSFDPYRRYFCDDVDIPCGPDNPYVNAFGAITSSAVVPEPSTFMLMLPALSAIVFRRRRRLR